MTQYNNHKTTQITHSTHPHNPHENNSFSLETEHHKSRQFFTSRLLLRTDGFIERRACQYKQLMGRGVCRGEIALI